jgi:phosphoglycerate dehydrogenase-like enzyme
MAAPVQLWVCDEPDRVRLGDLPREVELHVLSEAAPPPAAILEAEFLVPAYATQELLAALPRMHSLRVIQTVSAGIEWVLPAVPPGVTVCNARGIRDAAVSEWVLSVVLSHYKQLPRWHRQQVERRWQPALIDELAGRRVLIVGYGSIGQAVEARLRPFGVEVRRLARSERPGVHPAEALPELLAWADVVVVLLPLTVETERLLDARALARMKTDALLVNAGRGAVVDTDALLAELRQGRIHAALDVTDPEPLPGDHPLWDMDGVVITPHVAGDTREADRHAYRFIGEQLRRYVRGEQLANVVHG